MASASIGQLKLNFLSLKVNLGNSFSVWKESECGMQVWMEIILEGGGANGDGGRGSRFISCSPSPWCRRRPRFPARPSRSCPALGPGEQLWPAPVSSYNEKFRQCHQLLIAKVFLLPYLALTLVRTARWCSLELSFICMNMQVHAIYCVWIHFSYLLIPGEREEKPFGLSWNGTQVLLLYKRPLCMLDHSSMQKLSTEGDELAILEFVNGH